MPRFESFLPSQPVESLPRVFRYSEKRRHSRGLAAIGRVFGEENQGPPTEGAFSWTSLCCMNFQYPEFDRWSDQRPVAFWQRRGSKVVRRNATWYFSLIRNRSALPAL